MKSPCGEGERRGKARLRMFGSREGRRERKRQDGNQVRGGGLIEAHFLPKMDMIKSIK